MLSIGKLTARALFLQQFAQFCQDAINAGEVATKQFSLPVGDVTYVLDVQITPNTDGEHLLEVILPDDDSVMAAELLNEALGSPGSDDGDTWMATIRGE